jgi:23S rRNA (adenine2503-C2)-methyltransferase
MPEDLKSLTAEELSSWMTRAGQPPFRARQVLRWLYHFGVRSFDEMTDLPKDLRTRLAESFAIAEPKLVRAERSADGTRKLLFEVGPGQHVESVIIPMEPGAAEGEGRLTLCISSQVGCGMGCGFCATATLGLRRNLAAREIVDQVTAAKRELHDGRSSPGHLPITNIVFMGMGEPLHNYDEVVKAAGILTAEWAFGFSPRRITVSTVGLVPAMKRLLEDTTVNLAVSLSATTDETRAALMPVNRKYPLAALMAACRELPLPRRKRITFEYVMLDGLNDSLEDAARLARLLRGIPSKVNLIPFNPFPETSFRPSPRERIEAFRGRLLAEDIHATVRESRGQDIHAACGQLAARGAERPAA